MTKVEKAIRRSITLNETVEIEVASFELVISELNRSSNDEYDYVLILDDNFYDVWSTEGDSWRLRVSVSE